MENREKRSSSPEPSCVSMKSDASMDPPVHFHDKTMTSDPSIFRRRKSLRSSSPEPSCVSMKSDASMDPPVHFRDEKVTSDPRMNYEDNTSQNGQSLVEYVEVYMQLYHEEDHLPSIEFVVYALWVCGSSLTVGVLENNDTTISDSPRQSTPPAAISLPASVKTLRPRPECPDMTEGPPAAIPVMPAMPAIEFEPEPAPAADHKLEPLPCPDLVPATESTPEPEQVTAPVPRLGPFIRSSEESGSVKQFSDEPGEECWLINLSTELIPLHPTTLSILDEAIPLNFLPPIVSIISTDSNIFPGFTCPTGVS
ncbi:hypothetical protein DPX16_10288 [Anabarilius grahami]|uniref:Uncharacterized protein n=1 Tax=Anabarilius grahami TaxID=495550 RepID=A0A3N0YD29_ANAGA|nr:hypothetical protein DPX16_10288 [Anabarilius grahami]